ncbi:MAG: hypothetical protein LBC68_13655 [Prevotellaceae bacterium]|jgi:hypothetical protein|nr:hypothetical protein [Prevotellaceae bacterium]
MRKIIYAFITGIAITTLFAFTTQNYMTSNRTAEVNRYENLYIFTDCVPVSDYEYLGTVKLTVAWSGQYQGIRDKLIKKAKKEYPEAEGLIFNFYDGGTDKADVIKFK